MQVREVVPQQLCAAGASPAHPHLWVHLEVRAKPEAGDVGSLGAPGPDSAWSPQHVCSATVSLATMEPSSVSPSSQELRR